MSFAFGGFDATLFSLSFVFLDLNLIFDGFDFSLFGFNYLEILDKIVLWDGYIFHLIKNLKMFRKNVACDSDKLVVTLRMNIEVYIGEIFRVVSL